MRRLLTLLVMGWAATVAVAAPPVVSSDLSEERLQRLERWQESRAQQDTELQTRLDALQQELQALRGEMEEHGHQLKQLAEKQQTLEQRIGELQKQEDSPSTSPSVIAEASDATQQAPASAQQATPVEPSAKAQTEAVSAPTPLPVSARNAVASGNQLKILEEGFKLVKAKQYPAAAQVYRDFLAKFPQSAYAINARYWLGQSYYAQRQYDKAMIEFGTLIERYPNSPKSADAMLKIAIMTKDNGEIDKAQRLFADVTSRYPGSTAAQLAKKQLHELKRE